MGEEEKKSCPSLPPDYVSLAQLQERWLQKQREKKQQQEEEEEEEKERRAIQNETKNQRGRRDGKIRDRKIEKDGRAIEEEKGKGKEIATACSEGKKKRNRKKNKKYFRKKKNSEAEAEKQNEGFENGGDDVELGILGVSSEENRGRKGNSVVEDGVRGDNVRNGKMLGLNRRNGYNRGGSIYRNKKEEQVVKLDDELKDIEVKMASEMTIDDGKGKGERRINDENQERDDDLKEVDLKFEKKAAEDETVDGLKRRVGNRFLGQSKNRRKKDKEHRVEGEEGLKDNRVALEEKVENEVLVVEKEKDGGRRNELRKNGNRWGDRGRKFEGNRYASAARFGGRWRKEQRDNGMMWVKKEEKSSATGAAKPGSSGN